jgi:hypothetical protein
MVSTPNAPEGLFEHIEKELEETCLYKRLFLDYTYGLGHIYTEEEIVKAKESPSFEKKGLIALSGINKLLNNDNKIAAQQQKIS